MRFFVAHTRAPSVSIAAAVAASISSGCLFDPGVPANALVTCNTSAECPSEKICNTQSHLCVAGVGSDGVAPSFKAVTIDPPAGKAGSTFTVHLTASEPLIELPVVTVNTGNGSVALTLGAHDALTAQEPSFAYTYRVQGPGHEREGEAQLVGTLVDVSGNAADGIVFGALTFDFTPPAIVEGSVATVLASAVGNPLGQLVTKVTVGTTVTVLLSVSEPVAPGAVLSTPFPAGASSWTWDLVSQQDTTFIFHHTFAAGDVADGPLAATLGVADLAGNATSLDVPFAHPIVVDTHPPAAPDTSTPGAVVYTRAPWGSTTSALPTWHVHGDGLDATDAVGAIAYVEGGGAEIARAPTSAGSFDLDLPPGDRARVDVTTVDAAGNESARATVHDVTFVAGLNGKIAGSDVENPHALFGVVASGPGALAIGGAGAHELGDADGVGATDGASTTIAGGVTFVSQPPFRDQPVFNVASTIDPLAHAIVAVDMNRPATFAWSGAAWHTLGSTLSPEARDRTALVYDLARGRVVLFGGLRDGSGIALDDVWEFDDVTGWQPIEPADSVTPGPRAHFAMAYDEARAITVVLGGEGGAGAPNDTGEAPGTPATTWLWDGARWHAATTTDPEGDGDPVARTQAVAAFHRARGVVVLAGGEGVDFSSCTTQRGCDDTWTWNGTSWASIAGPQPTPRTDPLMAYDAARQKIVLFGGEDPATGTFLGDTWEWDGAWTLANAGGAGSPGPRERAVFAEDPDGGVLLSTGFDDTHSFSDVWRYDGAWHLLAPDGNVAQPSINDPCALVPSPDGGVLLVNPSHNTSLTETWQHANNVWSLVTTSNPPVRDNASIVFDPVRNVVVLFGGLSLDATTTFDDVWEYHGGGNWTEPFANGANGQPSPRRGATVAFNPITSTVELVSGFDINDNAIDDAWSYNGAWTQHPAAAARPTPRAFASAAFDPNLGGIVLYGGLDQNETPLGDTWLDDASGWHQINPSTSPPIRAGAAVAFVPALGGVTLFGGRGADSLLAQTWVLRRNAWTMLAHADRDGDGEPDAAAPWGQAAVDPQTGAVVVLVDGSIFTLDGPIDRPAAVFRLNARSALARPGSTTTSLVIEAQTGATSSTQPGSIAIVWNGRTFVNVGANAATVDAPASLSASVPAPLFHAVDAQAQSRDGFVYLGLAANGATGAADTSIAIDAVDVAWSYREP